MLLVIAADVLHSDRCRIYTCVGLERVYLREFAMAPYAVTDLDSTRLEIIWIALVRYDPNVSAGEES
jgi:hypothetical protein